MERVDWRSLNWKEEANCCGRYNPQQKVVSIIFGTEHSWQRHGRTQRSGNEKESHFRVLVGDTTERERS